MKKILICDDQKRLRDVLRESILQMRDDIEVHEATDGLEALASIERHDFDLILLDVEMPNLSGFQALEKIREKEQPGDQRLRVVMVTALNTSQDIIKGWELDADGYISKPYDIDEISEALDQSLGKSVTP